MRVWLGLYLAMCLIAALVIGCAETPGASQSGADMRERFDYAREINVNAREDGSGTRSAFVELFGIEQNDANGNAFDQTTLEANITNSTSVMMLAVAGDRYGIGYISLGSLNDMVKALRIDGVEVNAKNIKNGDYTIARPFIIACGETLREPARAFVRFIMSAEGQAVIEHSGYISAMDQAAAYDGATPKGKVVVAGSSSVTPVMEKLKEAYQAINPNAVIEVQQSDSSTGMRAAIDGICDIGMASRTLKESELDAGLAPTVIAMDGIAVIVNNENPIVSLAKAEISRVYIEDALDWSALVQ